MNGIQNARSRSRASSPGRSFLWCSSRIGLRAIASVLPFQSMVSTPALTYLGTMDGPTTALMIGIQVAWAVALLLLGRLVWRSAVKAVTINGG